jgi:hypothetical protein
MNMPDSPESTVKPVACGWAMGMTKKRDETRVFHLLIDHGDRIVMPACGRPLYLGNIEVDTSRGQRCGSCKAVMKRLNLDPDAIPEARRVRGAAKLACPHCPAQGLENFVYIEDVQNYRKLISLSRGLLMIQSYYQVFDEGSKNPRLLCQSCDKECAIPTKLELDWE